VLAVLFLLLIVFPAIALHGGSCPPSPDTTEAEKLIDKAKYQYGLVEDYPAALILLEAAIREAKNPVIKAEALINKAYVFFLMKKNVEEYKPLMDEALTNNPALKTNPIYYHKTFVDIFDLLKKKPGDYQAQIQTKATVIEDKHVKRKKFFVKAGVSYSMLLDQRFRDIYSGGYMQPRLGVGYMPGKVVFLWADYRFFTANGMIPDSDLSTSVTQRFLSAGFGFMGRFSKKMEFKIEIGLGNYQFKEEALDTSASGSLIGYSIDSALLYNIGKFLYLEASVGFRSGKKGGDDVGDIKMDGIHSGLSLEFRF